MAPPIGESLREARARRGIELSDVERATKIRVKYLRAMEEERWELLAGAAYARGFLRTYGSFLGLTARPSSRNTATATSRSRTAIPRTSPSSSRHPGPGGPA